MRRIVALLATALLIAGIAGCGGGGAEPGGPQGATLLLDFTPNAVHAGIYAAKAEGYYRQAGVDLTIQQPGESTDAPKLLASGGADFAILDIHDLGIDRERGLDLVGVMPIVHRALASVLTLYEGDVRRPRDLEGRTVGVTGLPSDNAILDAEVKADGGDPAKVHKVTIGFNAVPALAAKRVDAVTAFWNAEGVELERMEVPLHRFIVDRYGAPKYPELVLATSGDTLKHDPGLVKAVVHATMRGYELTLNDSGTALADLLAANPSLYEREQRERLDVIGPYIHPNPFRPYILREWAAWDLKHGILKRPLDVNAAFDLNG
jgi:putative hydroxymethylpyrimidine transport system substrate-binding protein